MIRRLTRPCDTIARGWEFNHWPKPQIREKHDPDRVELTLMIGQNSSMGNQGSTTPDTTPGTTPIEDKQNTREKIIQIIKSTPNVSTLGLAKMCGITKDGAKYHLTKLKKEGKIRYSKEDGGIPRGSGRITLITHHPLASYDIRSTSESFVHTYDFYPLSILSGTSPLQIDCSLVDTTGILKYLCGIYTFF